MDPFLLAVILLVIALGLLVIDLFIPSGGVLLVLTGITALAAVLAGYRVSVATGNNFLITVLLSIPVLLWLFVKVWPNTPIGKRILGELPVHQDVHWSGLRQVQDAESLIGRTGMSTVELMPAGQVEIDGKVFDSLSEGRPIAVGMPVRVLRIDMGRLVVAEIEANVGPLPTSQGLDSPRGDSLLDRPIEELGLESLNNE